MGMEEAGVEEEDDNTDGLDEEEEVAIGQRAAWQGWIEGCRDGG